MKGAVEEVCSVELSRCGAREVHGDGVLNEKLLCISLAGVFPLSAKDNGGSLEIGVVAPETAVVMSSLVGGIAIHVNTLRKKIKCLDPNRHIRPNGPICDKAEAHGLF